MNCSYAFPGTYGHECGKPAVTVAVKPSDTKPGAQFLSGRCAECRDLIGPDNAKVTGFEPLDPNHKSAYWR